MNETDVLKRAKFYMDSLAEGKNPLTGEELSEDCEIAKESFYKCFDYISGVLSRVIEEKSQPSERRGGRASFYLSPEDMERVQVSSEPVGINTVAARINEIIDQSRMKGVSGGKLAECLLELGYLETEISSDGGRIRRATAKGIMAGIETVEKTDSVGKSYRQNVYSLEMQRFLINNINDIISHEPKQEARPVAHAADPAEADLPDGADADDDIYDIYGII